MSPDEIRWEISQLEALYHTVQDEEEKEAVLYDLNRLYVMLAIAELPA